MLSRTRVSSALILCCSWLIFLNYSILYICLMILRYSRDSRLVINYAFSQCCIANYRHFYACSTLPSAILFLAFHSSVSIITHLWSIKSYMLVKPFHFTFDWSANFHCNYIKLSILYSGSVLRYGMSLCVLLLELLSYCYSS